FISSANSGRVLENAVFLELKRRGRDVYYFKEKNECDFIIREKNRPDMAIQVTKRLDAQNDNREINGILEAMEKLKLKKGIIITEDQEEERIIKGKKIKIVPVYKWLLED
ncbi:MAG TPA: DUF4143 domain-containing protein, partial [Candidatus Saccharimonadales bacterium]|nr:DUF4143 domain-containing protein [Candidatus Saccharimonadales bacterium]